MHKFEVVDYVHPEMARAKNEMVPVRSAKPQVKVTMLSQVDLGSDQDNYEIYNGMLKAMAITSLKKNVVLFYNSWSEALQKQAKSR